MPDENVHTWDKVQEIRSGRFSFIGDGSVRLVASSLTTIARDIAAHARPGSIGEVIVCLADASGWRTLPSSQYSWAWQVRRPRRQVAPPGAVTILIGLSQPTADGDGLAVLQPCLAPGARLLVAGHKFTLEHHASTTLDPYRGFTGGVFVAT